MGTAVAERPQAITTQEQPMSAMEYAEKIGAGDTYLFRARHYPFYVAQEVDNLFEEHQKPIRVQIDGDKDGRDAVSMRLAQVKQEFEKIMAEGRTQTLDVRVGAPIFTEIMQKLAKNFPMFRQDIRPSTVEDRTIDLSNRDIQLAQAAGMLPYVQAYLTQSEETGEITINEPLFKAMGPFETGDASEGSGKPPALEVRLSQNLWNHIPPDLRDDYARNISASQLPGSLVVLGMAELNPEFEVEKHLREAGYEPAEAINPKMADFIKLTRRFLPDLTNDTLVFEKQ